MIYFDLLFGFLKVGLFAFGGAYGAIPLIRDVVLSYGWIEDEMLTYMIAVSESTPGPIMVNLATYVGSSQAGFWGSLIATTAVVLPSFIIILLIMGVGSIMSVGFEKAYLMQNNLNLAHSELISTYVYKVGLAGTGTGKTDFSYSTAIGLFNSLVNLVLIMITNTISRRVSETSLW